jgi:hypothetical protein
MIEVELLEAPPSPKATETQADHRRVDGRPGGEKEIHGARGNDDTRPRSSLAIEPRGGMLSG